VLLWKQLVTEKDVGADHIDVIAAAARWSARLSRQIDEGKAFVAERNGKLVGFAGYIGRITGDESEKLQNNKVEGSRLPIPPGIAYITDLYVTPATRRRGLAQSLLDAILRSSKSLGFQAVWTNTNSRNRRTLSLLAKLGFTPLGDFQISGLENQVYHMKAL
jgi:ribosomal protein S18 acetylase RimI-like enzyme